MRAGLVCALAWLCLAQGAAAQTTMFRGGATHAGIYASAAPRSLPKIKWSFPTGDRVVSSAAWQDGTLFFGSDDGHVYAVDAASGRQRWKFRTGGPVAASPALAGGRVFVGSYDGRFYALDAASGELVWKFSTAGERRFEARGLHGFLPLTQTYADPFDVYLSSPVLAAGRVFFGSGDGHVYALDQDSGDLLWKFNAGEVVHASPAVADGVVYVGDWASRLYAIDAGSGQQKWRFQAGTDALIYNQVGFQSSPAVVGGVVYIGCRDSHLYAIDAATGAEKWRFSTGASWVIGSPAVHGGRVFFNTSDSSLLHVADAATGQPLWQQQGKAFMFASPVIAGDVLLAAVLNGSLQGRDRDSGALLWEWRTEAARQNHGWVLTSEGRFNSGWLFANTWREKSAAATERQFSVGSLFATPLVVGGVIYVGSADGRMYALE